MKYRPNWNLLTSVSALLLLTACGTTSPSRFYTLEPADSIVRPSAAASTDQIAVLVGPFRFADYLDRPHIVSRQGEAELEIAEFDRWAAPLPAVFQRTVAANLTKGLGSQRVLEFPTNLTSRGAYQVNGRVTRFDTDAGGRAVLTVQWGIQSSDGAPVKPFTRSHYEHETNGSSYRARVGAQSATVAEFSRDIASAIIDLQN